MYIFNIRTFFFTNFFALFLSTIAFSSGTGEDGDTASKPPSVRRMAPPSSSSTTERERKRAARKKRMAESRARLEKNEKAGASANERERQSKVYHNNCEDYRHLRLLAKKLGSFIKESRHTSRVEPLDLNLDCDWLKNLHRKILEIYPRKGAQNFETDSQFSDLWESESLSSRSTMCSIAGEDYPNVDRVDFFIENERKIFIREKAPAHLEKYELILDSFATSKTSDVTPLINYPDLRRCFRENNIDSLYSFLTLYPFKNDSDSATPNTASAAKSPLIVTPLKSKTRKLADLSLITESPSTPLSRKDSDTLSHVSILASLQASNSIHFDSENDNICIAKNSLDGTDASAVDAYNALPTERRALWMKLANPIVSRTEHGEAGGGSASASKRVDTAHQQQPSPTSRDADEPAAAAVPHQKAKATTEADDPGKTHIALTTEEFTELQTIEGTESDSEDEPCGGCCSKGKNTSQKKSADDSV